LVLPECGGNSLIIRLKAEVLLLLRFANAHEIYFMVSTDSKPRTTSLTLGVLMNFITELSPVSPSVKVAFPRALSMQACSRSTCWRPQADGASISKVVTFGRRRLASLKTTQKKPVGRV
jgi:hypothetical protein